MKTLSPTLLERGFFMLLPRGCPMYGLSHGCRQLAKYRVAVEKLRFPSKRPKFGGYKMSTKLRKSFVGHPSAILFSRISGEGVFQQPRDFSPIDSKRRYFRDLYNRPKVFSYSARLTLRGEPSTSYKTSGARAGRNNTTEMLGNSRMSVARLLAEIEKPLSS